MSRPIVVIACMTWLLRIVGPQQHPHPWRSCAGGGAVHSINCGHQTGPSCQRTVAVLLAERRRHHGELQPGRCRSSSIRSSPSEARVSRPSGLINRRIESRPRSQPLPFRETQRSGVGCVTRRLRRSSCSTPWRTASLGGKPPRLPPLANLPCALRLYSILPAQ